MIQVIRTLIDYDKHTVRDYEWNKMIGDNENVMRWCPPQRSMFYPDGLHYCFLDGNLHRNGLTKELKQADVQKYLEGHEMITRKLIEQCDERNSNCYHKYIRYFEKLAEMPVLEQLTKCRLYNLVIDSLNNRYNSICTDETSILKILKIKNKTILRDAIKTDITSSNLNTIHTYYKTTDQERPIAEILDIASFFRGREEYVFPFTDRRIRMTREYLENLNHINPQRNNYVPDYFDYINACQELEYDMNSELVLYPKDFITAHDSAITNLSNQKLEKEYEKIKNLLPQMHQKYDFSNDKYLIKAPDSGRDITYEGQALHHCVSGYVSWVADQKTVILFLRKQKEPNKPFVTIEVRNNKIIQVRGFSNHNPEPEVLDFVEEFKSEKLIA